MAWRMYYVKGIIAVRDSIAVLKRQDSSQQKEWQFVTPYTFESLEQGEVELILEGSKVLGLGSDFYVAAVEESLQKSMILLGVSSPISIQRLLCVKSYGRGTRTLSKESEIDLERGDHLHKGL